MIQNKLDLKSRVLFPRPGFHRSIKFRRIVLSKPAASRGWVCAFCVVPVLAVVAIALLALSPATHRGTAVSASSSASRPKTATPAARSRIQASYAALPLAFERNEGQTDAQVEYMARGNGYTLFLTANDAVFSLHSHSASSETPAARRGVTLRAKNQAQPKAHRDLAAVVRMQLVGGNSSAKVSASNRLPGTSNYFIGNDPSKWRSDVAHYARVSYQDVYPGVNLAYHGAQRQTEFDFVVAPGANPAPIGFHFTGARHVKTDDSGNLVISSTAGDVLLHKPVAYQEQNGARQIVDARFALKADNQVSFELGSYDRSRELVIDPTVTYSTYLGGSAEDEGYGVAFDASGNAYVTGQTSSSDFPSVGGLGPNPNASGFSVFVTKIASSGSSLIYSTYVGGTSEDSSANGIAVDGSGNAYVAGGTTAPDFPTHGAYQGSYGGGGDAFVFKLSSTGASLTYSTYLGGSGADLALGIAIDSSNNAYVTGSTESSGFPGTSTSAVQSAYGGGTDAFVTKLNSTGNSLLYSTYLGGSDLDLGGGIGVDSSTGEAYVVGSTESGTNFPLQSAVQSAFGGGTSDAFVAKLNAGGTALVFSTFLGGGGADAGDGIAVDSTGAYVVGTTESTNFTTTAGVLQANFGGGTDAFVTKLMPDGSALVYSTYLGGSGFDAGASIAVDSSGIAYVTGQTASPFPTVNPTQSAPGGNNDAFVSEISSTGAQLVFSTYLGGSGNEDNGGDYGAIAVDGPGANIYVTGNTASTDFPTQSPFPYSGGDANAGGAADAFAVKYAQGPSFTVVATTPAAVAPGTSATSTVTLTAYHNYNSSVTLSCAVTGGGSPAPACSATSFTPDSVTPTTTGATSALAITTTGASGAMFFPRKVFYAMWLPIAGMSVVGMGFSTNRSRRKKVLGFLMITMVMAALFIMPACGGSSGGGGGGGGCAGCTPAGSYTVTITGTDASATTGSTQIMLTVN
jgi:hypothetical protein